MLQSITMQELLAERGTTHGKFEDNSAISQAIKSVVSQGNNWPNLEHFQREALDMIAHKIGRILSGDANFRDHWDDIAGYAKLVADRCR